MLFMVRSRLCTVCNSLIKASIFVLLFHEPEAVVVLVLVRPLDLLGERTTLFMLEDEDGDSGDNGEDEEAPFSRLGSGMTSVGSIIVSQVGHAGRAGFTARCRSMHCLQNM